MQSASPAALLRPLPAPIPGALPPPDPTAPVLRDASGARGVIRRRTTAIGSLQARYECPAWEHPLMCNAFPCRRRVMGATKRALDVVLAASLLALTSPLFAAVAMAIKLDSKGPVFFRQNRNGVRLKIFRIYKFRTMTTMEDEGGVRQAVSDDDRVTRVGRVLRATSLDELPQLINVLRGEMSIVGPRPHALVHDATYSEELPEYALRFRAKPGLTGLAQIRGARGPIFSTEDVTRRIRSDLEYQRRCSVLLDLWIVLVTPLCLVSHFLTKRAF